MYVVPKNSIKSTKSMVEDSDKSKTGSVKVDVLLDQAVLLQLSSNYIFEYIMVLQMPLCPSIRCPGNLVFLGFFCCLGIENRENYLRLAECKNLLTDRETATSVS